MSNSVAKIVTDTILERMEKAEQNGEMFRWIKPWNSGIDRAYSYETLLPYSGINRLLLDNNLYITYNAMQRINDKKDSPQYHIRKGAKSNIVCYYNTVPVKDKDSGEPIIDEESGLPLEKGFLKYYRVFSREDIIQDNGECLPSKIEFEHFSHEDATEQMRQALDRFNRIFNYYCEKNGIEVQIVRDGTQAYFSHNMKIRVPDISNFNSIYNWVHTVAHEMAHSTGMFLGRFNDQEPQEIEEAMKSYSREELIAEITSEMLCASLCIQDDSETPDNAIAYIYSWSDFLKKNRPTEIISAAAKAETACELIMEHLRELELTEARQNNKEEEREER